MNPKDMFGDLPGDEREELAHLVDVSDGLQPSAPFIKRTEMQLKDAFAAKKDKTMKRFNLLWQVLAGTAAIVLLTIGTIWLVRIALPKTPSPAVPVDSPFVCPVTQPNGSLPPGETNDSPFYLGNGQLWTSLWPDGKVIMNEMNNRQPDGSLSMKWGWVRGVKGPLTIEGHRLDGSTEPLQADIPSGYGDTGLQVSALIFPTTGCWEVIGHVGDASLTFVTEVVMEAETPSPQPTVTPMAATTVQDCQKVNYEVQANDTLASIAANSSISVDELKSYNGLNTDTVYTGQSLMIPLCKQYNWHGTTVLRAADFPKTPDNAMIYTHSALEPATIESARKLAERFGVQGDVSLDSSGFIGATSYLVTDGKQRLSVSSSGEFSYYADYSKAFVETPGSLAVASSSIDSFLKAHDFNFEYKIEPANGIGSDWFYVIPLSLDGRQIRYDFGLMQNLTIHVGSDGQVISLDAHLLNLDSQPVGTFGLISAEDAWQGFLKDSSPGILQSSRGGGSERLLWQRTYSDNQPLTLYGRVQSFAPAEAGKSSLISVDGFIATGNIAGMEKLAFNTFVRVQGQFFNENGIHRLKVDSWELFDQTGQQYLEGSLHKDGGKVIFTSDEKEYDLGEVPADVPVPVDNIAVTGVPDGTFLNWQSMIYYKSPARGGGGGCGGSFAKLNLAGAPVPWPTPTQVVSPSNLPTGQYIDGKRGTILVSIFEQTNGIKRTEYGFFSQDAQYILQGQGLEQLNGNHNRPVTIWGTVTGYTQYQMPIVTVERFEIPYPGLKFQILHGTQKQITVDGQQVTLFTTDDGKSYAQLRSAGHPDDTLIGVPGDLVEYEALIIPNETFGGYPAMHVFQGAMAITPKNGQPFKMEITADQPNVVPEPVPENSPVSIMTIDSIELVYYTPNPQYARDYPDAMSPYIQPVWRFSGHYSDGSTIEILIQALNQDFLLPEAAPAIQCG